MGIQLLTAYVNSEFPKIKESLASIVERHVQTTNPPNKRLKILFDGFALLFHLFESRNLHRFPLCWLNGGDYLVIASRIVQYLKAWVKFEQVKLVIIFDGCQEEKKQATTTKRKQAYIDLNKFMFKYHKKPMKQEAGNMRTSTLPPFVKQAFLFAAKSFSDDQIEIIQSPYEADFMLAKFANDENCFVVTNDSDFFIFPSAGCITLRDIEFRDNMEIWFACTTNRMLADKLKLKSVELLNGLACLSKNDYNTGKGIEHFHAHLDQIYPRMHQMEQIALFINDNISNDNERSTKDKLFEVFEKAILRDDSEEQKQLLAVTKQIYDDFDVDKLDEKSKFFNYDWIIAETEKNRQKRPEIINAFKTLKIDSDLVDLSTNHVIQLNILIEDPSLKGVNQLWTILRQRIYAYHFFHKHSPWNPYMPTPDETNNSGSSSSSSSVMEPVSIEEGMIIDGEYKLHISTIDEPLFNNVFGQQQDGTNMEIFTTIWKLANVEPQRLASVLNSIDKCFWPIICVYLALKSIILPQEPRLVVYDWELESIFASFFQMDVSDRSKILEYHNYSFEPKRYNSSFRTNDWTSATFHELISLIHAGLRMFELCNSSINFVIPSHLFGVAVLLNNGSLQKVMYEKTREQQGVIWFVDEEHYTRYHNFKKLIAEVDLITLPKQQHFQQPVYNGRRQRYSGERGNSRQQYYQQSPESAHRYSSYTPYYNNAQPVQRTGASYPTPPHTPHRDQMYHGHYPAANYYQQQQQHQPHDYYSPRQRNQQQQQQWYPGQQQQQQQQYYPRQSPQSSSYYHRPESSHPVTTPTYNVPYPQQYDRRDRYPPSSNYPAQASTGEKRNLVRDERDGPDGKRRRTTADGQ